MNCSSESKNKYALWLLYKVVIMQQKMRQMDRIKNKHYY